MEYNVRNCMDYIFGRQLVTSAARRALLRVRDVVVCGYSECISCGIVIVVTAV